VNALEPVQICHYLTLRGIKDHELVCIHVGDVQTSLSFIKALIVKTHCRTRHGNVRDCTERGFSRSGTLRYGTE
jgi:hypothetical protein